MIILEATPATGLFLGVAGTPTNLIDSVGNKLKVGDMVSIYTYTEKAGLKISNENAQVIIYPPNHNDEIICGIGHFEQNTECYFKNRKLVGKDEKYDEVLKMDWDCGFSSLPTMSIGVIKKRDWNDLKSCEIIDKNIVMDEEELNLKVYPRHYTTDELEFGSIEEEIEWLKKIHGFSYVGLKGIKNLKEYFEERR